MNVHTIRNTVSTFGLALVASAALSGIAGAATPSYAQPSGDRTIRGHITQIVDKYDLRVRDDRGYIDNVRLHQGTIINPTGLTLAPGMAVTIAGDPSGNVFAASEIDTPYTQAYVYPGYERGWGSIGWWGPTPWAGIGFGI